MKNSRFILNSVITGFIVLISSSITAYATSYLYNAKDVSYDNANSGLTSTDVQGAMEELYAEATNYSDMRKLIYPVGSIYFSVTDDTVEKVQERFGGTWEVFGQGKTIVGVNTSETEFNTIEKTGGEKTHTLTINEIPSHSHRQYVTANSGTVGVRKDWSSDGKAAAAYDQGINTGAVGGGGAHNNLQPYITVYMYKRVA